MYKVLQGTLMMGTSPHQCNQLPALIVQRSPLHTLRMAATLGIPHLVGFRGYLDRPQGGKEAERGMIKGGRNAM